MIYCNFHYGSVACPCVAAENQEELKERDLKAAEKLAKDSVVPEGGCVVGIFRNHYHSERYHVSEISRSIAEVNRRNATFMAHLVRYVVAENTELLNHEIKIALKSLKKKG